LATVTWHPKRAQYPSIDKLFPYVLETHQKTRPQADEDESSFDFMTMPELLLKLHSKQSIYLTLPPNISMSSIQLPPKQKSIHTLTPNNPQVFSRAITPILYKTEKKKRKKISTNTSI